MWIVLQRGRATVNKPNRVQDLVGPQVHVHSRRQIGSQPVVMKPATPN